MIFTPPSIRAISSTRAASSSTVTSLTVSPSCPRFAIRHCQSAQAAAVQEQGEPERDRRNWGEAVWVKTFTTVTKQRDIDLGDLLIDRERGEGGRDLRHAARRWQLV